MSNPQFLYRVRVERYPAGAFHQPNPEIDDYWEPTPGWAPAGWRPEGRYVEIMGTSDFVWPVTNKVYHSRSTAKKRAALLESYGATADVERSSRITWPQSDELDAEDAA
ncbi:hypothetical protein [Rhodococcus erythropolis]|uniref:hypothetical protein n=1 Tax=Rhodococcus erythropolis TaxID=1833 RepID=UPI0036DDC9C2